MAYDRVKPSYLFLKRRIENGKWRIKSDIRFLEPHAHVHTSVDRRVRKRSQYLLIQEVFFFKVAFLKRKQNNGLLFYTVSLVTTCCQ